MESIREGKNSSFPDSEIHFYLPNSTVKSFFISTVAPTVRCSSTNCELLVVVAGSLNFLYRENNLTSRRTIDKDSTTLKRFSKMNGLREELQEKGFVKIPRSLFVLDDDKLTDLRKEFDDLFQGKFETGIYPDEINWRQGISKDNVTKELCNAWKASTKISETVRSPELGRLACALMGWKSSRIGQDDVLDKPPKSYACVGFHQDGAYISDNFVPREDNSLTMWIALDDSDKENGALVYAPGSHRWRSQIGRAHV